MHSRSDDGRLEVKLSSPGTKGDGTNPEQLFATGWSACFIGAMQVAAGKLQARLNISLPGMARETARALVDEGHKLCPYSKTTRGNINVEINLI
ncbi:hypothetical protein FQ187_12065 [Pseudomonas sp. ANT_J28]|nr:hypothetical protein [Pseudomonas sp. ANT_J28]KAA0983508.1 hypothetical protein FQ187_12065 [Pseudomonas sp. ANT_J28]